MEFGDSDFSFLRPNSSAGSSLWNFHHGFRTSSSLSRISGLATPAAALIPSQYIEEVDDDEEDKPEEAVDNVIGQPQEEQAQASSTAPRAAAASASKKKRSRDDAYGDADEEDNDDEAFADDSGDDDHDARAPRSSRNRQVVDITEYLCLPQSDAAVKLGLPVSTLSKRWKESAKNRKWPFRKVAKLDKEIAQLLQGVPQDGPRKGMLTEELEEQIGQLLKQRQEELRKVTIRI